MNNLILIFIVILIVAGAVVVPKQLEARRQHQAAINTFITSWTPTAPWEDKLALANNFLTTYNNVDTILPSWVIPPSTAQASKGPCHDLGQELASSEIYKDQTATTTYTEVRKILKCI